MDTYYKLLDKEAQNVIVKQCDNRFFECKFGETDHWVRTGMNSYFSDESSRYDQYTEIAEEEALKEIATQKQELFHIYEEIQKNVDRSNPRLNYMMEKLTDDDVEQKIIAIFFALGVEFYESQKGLLQGFPRICMSIETLILCIQNVTEKHLLYLRITRNTRKIAIAFMQYAYENQMLPEEKYQLVLGYLEQKIIFWDEEQKKILFE